MNPDLVFAIIVVGSFVASVFNAMFSAGGALIILAITATVLPVQAIVPIHSALLIGSAVSRIALFRAHIDWSIVWPFLVGSLIGSLAGARAYIELPESILATAIGVLMLVALWLPQVTWRPRMRHPWAVVGLVHSFISTLFAYGAVLHAVVLHTTLNRRQIVGTMAGCLSGMSVFKIAGYAWFGFDYAPFYIVITAAFAASLIGSWLGKQMGDGLPENWFRLVYRALVTITAVRLLYSALADNL